MFGAVWCALAAVSTQVGDPRAEYFQGVALTRCKGTVTPEDEATAEHLVDELKKLRKKHFETKPTQNASFGKLDAEMLHLGNSHLFHSLICGPFCSGSSTS